MAKETQNVGSGFARKAVAALEANLKVWQKRALDSGNTDKDAVRKTISIESDLVALRRIADRDDKGWYIAQ